MVKLFDDVNIKAIADAIRAKNGSADTYKPSEMAAAIDSISTTPRIVTYGTPLRLYHDGNRVDITGIDTKRLVALYVANVFPMPAGTSASTPDVATMFINIAEKKIGMSYHYLHTASGKNYSYSVSSNAMEYVDIDVNEYTITMLWSGFEGLSFASYSESVLNYGWMCTAIYAG